MVNQEQNVMPMQFQNVMATQQRNVMRIQQQNVMPMQQQNIMPVQPRNERRHNRRMQQRGRPPMGRSEPRKQQRIFEKNQKSLFKEIEKCKQYCETHYYEERSNKNFKKLSKKSEFYSSFIEHILENKPKDMKDLSFLTCNFIYSSITLTDLMAVLALMDLPWQSAPDHSFEPTGERGIKIVPKTNMLLFKKELQSTECEINENIMVIHRFFDEGNKSSEMKILEYLNQRVYGCEVIITNVSSFTQEIQSLWQIPEGAVPLMKYNYQKSENVSLSPYSTKIFEFMFYFPKSGNYVQFPTNVSANGKVIARSKNYTFKVVSKKDSSSFERFSDLALSGDKEAILKFLKEGNLFSKELQFHMKHIRPFCSDKKFYESAIKICRDRRVFGFDLWKYSFKHFDIAAIQELIETESDCQKSTGVYFNSSLIKCNPDKSDFRYFDFLPMINPRAHKLENEKSAVMFNTQFRVQYERFLINLIEKGQLQDEDNLIFSTYLLLQDRIEEAHKLYEKVNAENFKDCNKDNLVIQYDYLSTYFDILLGYETGFKVARKISKHYEEFPVISWRMRFTEIIDQLKEFDGEEVNEDEIDLENIDKKKENDKKLKKLEPMIDFSIEDKQININFENIESINVKYYIVNPEILFTREPFEMKNFEMFSYVKPVHQSIKVLPPGSKIFAFEVDKDYQDKNVLIELDSGSKKCIKTYFPCSLKILPLNFDEIKVVDSDNKPIPRAYVKAFAMQHNGSVQFYKDGYTDMRGKFEYGSTNAQKLSLMVFSDKYGCSIKEIKLKNVIIQDTDIGFLNHKQAQRYMCSKAVNPPMKSLKKGKK